MLAELENQERGNGAMEEKGQTKEEKLREEVVFASDSRGWGSEQEPKSEIFSSGRGWGSERKIAPGGDEKPHP